MKKENTCFERRIEMLFLIIQRRKVGAPELAERFEVSKTTIYNDIAFLSRYAPIYTKNGLGGGIYILEEYRNDIFRYLSKKEEKCLRDILPHLDRTQRNIVENIINKFTIPSVADL